MRRVPPDTYLHFFFCINPLEILSPGTRSIPRHRIFLHEFPNFSNLFRRKFDILRRPVVLQIRNLPRPRDRKEIFSLRQDPRQRQLSCTNTLLLRETLELCNKRGIGGHVFFGKPGEVLAAVVGGVCRHHVAGCNGAGEETAAEGAVAHDCDAQLAAGGQEVLADPGLDFADKGRVFDLDCSYGGDSTGAAERFGGHFAETDMLNFALARSVC